MQEKSVVWSIGYGQLFSKRTIIAKPLSEQLLPFDKAEVLAKQKSILDKVKDFIDTDLNPKKRNFLNPNKENYHPIAMDIEDILESVSYTHLTLPTIYSV